MNFFRLSRDITSVGPETITTIGGIPITNSFLLILVIILSLIIFAVFTVRRFKLIPNTFQSIIEMIYEGIVGLINQITASDLISKRVFPLVAALFVYVGLSNLISLIPGVTSITYNGVALLRTPTSDFNTTLGLALGSVLIIQIASIRDYGIFGYIGRFIKIKELIQGFRKGIKEGIMASIDFLIGLLDIISEFAKVISLSFRLFGNMLAGEIIAVLVLGAIAYVLPALWLSMNLLFAVVQAVVFGSLVAAYYTLALKPKEEEKEDR